MTHLHRWIRRVWLFARDYFSEFGVAWSIARCHDCERNGGHRWGPATDDPLFGHGRTCTRCGMAEAVYPTSGTGWSSSNHGHALTWKFTP